MPGRRVPTTDASPGATALTASQSKDQGGPRPKPAGAPPGVGGLSPALIGPPPLPAALQAWGAGGTGCAPALGTGVTGTGNAGVSWGGSGVSRESES